MVVDDRFSWSHHVDVVCDKLRAILAKIHIIRYKMPYKVLLNLYIALAESVISYGLTSYGRTFKTYLAKIFNLQLRLLKSIIPKPIKLRYIDNALGVFQFCGVLPVHEKVKVYLLTEQFENSDIKIPITHNIITRKITQ